MKHVLQDLVSYDVKQSVDQAKQDLITIAMRKFDMNIQAAVYWCVHLHAKKRERFRASCLTLHVLGDKLTPDVIRFVNLLGYWVRANLEWSFECGRYFGNRGPEIKTARVIELRPKMAVQCLDLIGDNAENMCA